MKKKKLNYNYLSMGRFLYIAVILLAVIIQSCATTSKSEKRRLEMASFAEENAGCCVEKGYLGATVILNKKKELEIASVGDDTPAGKAGIRAGDIVLKIDNENVKDKYHAFLLYDSKYPGDTTSLTIKRKDEVITKQFQLTSHHFLNIQYSLLELVYKDIPVRLAVIFGNVDYGHPYLKDVFGKQESYYIGAFESNFLSMFRNQNNFTIIDRQKTDAILNELKFQQSGLVDNKSREKLGNMLGATHLLIMDISIADCKEGYLMVIRLIDISSGKALSVSTMKIPSDNLVKMDIADYYEKIEKISVLEAEAITAYSNVTGDNYKDDTTFHNALVNTVIPKYEAYRQQFVNISPTTRELGHVHQLGIESLNLTIQACKYFQKAIAQNDKELIDKGNQSMKLAKQKRQEAKMEFEKLSK